MPRNTSETTPGPSSSPELRTTALDTYTPADLRGISGGRPDPFEVSHLGLTWRPKEHHFGVVQGERLVAHAGWVDLPVRVGGAQVRVAGLGGVIVAPELRGHGLARRVVSATAAHAAEQGYGLALLFCLPDRTPVYAAMGWTRLAAEVEAEQPGGTRTVMPLPAMWLPLGGDASWPHGRVSLLSLPM
ncbi:GNAT family N-acetyltransferase [Streptomyces catenulae]|uniref:GNAT family N-acetyltransferase n=1 Tax=Streptomyces catenulae TaxID=66875 RepID=A0ABV2YS50_9ACTN|nr:GNAT family N-acetyltransferase [Streptomyces catenulae]